MARRAMIGVDLGGSVVAAGLVTADGEVLAQSEEPTRKRGPGTAVCTILDLVLDFARALKVPVRSQDDLVRAAARERGLRTPDHFMGESGPEPYWSRERTLKHLASLPAGVSEFMTHPGYFDDDLAYSRYGKQRETEMAGLTGPEVREAIARHGIRLAHFGSL